jgi:hypothetical protein
MIQWIFGLIIVCLVASPVCAQGLDFDKAAKNAARASKPATPPSEGEQRQLKLSEQYYGARLNYDIGALEHAANVFRWQLLSSKVIFAVCILVLVSGLGLSFMQFKAGFGENQPAPTTLKVGAAGLEITSSLIGLLILAVSLVFFYGYLRYVYPIQQLSTYSEKAAPQREP